MRFRDYPRGFRVLAFFDVVYLALVVGSFIWIGLANVSTSAEIGRILALSIDLIIALAYVLVLWRQKLITQANTEKLKRSIYVIMAGIPALLALSVAVELVSPSNLSLLIVPSTIFVILLWLNALRVERAKEHTVQA